MVEAEIVLDSVNAATGDRITTTRVVFPRYLLAELVTHRILFVDAFHDLTEVLHAYDADIPHDLSKNAASSRAVPVTRMIERVWDNPFIPRFRTAQKGMTSGEPVADNVQEIAEAAVRRLMQVAIETSELLYGLNIEKGQANRYLEPHSHIEVLLTATEWNNFFLLRDHPGAQTEIRELAQAIKRAMNDSEPRILQPGEWHLPYDEGYTDIRFAPTSAARCARISYRSLATNKPSTYKEDMDLFGKLTAGNPKHLSPCEHPARAQNVHERHGNLVGWKSLRKIMFNGEEKGGDLAGVE